MKAATDIPTHVSKSERCIHKTEDPVFDHRVSKVTVHTLDHRMNLQRPVSLKTASLKIKEENFQRACTVGAHCKGRIAGP